MKMNKPNLFKHLASLSVVALFIGLSYGSGDDKKTAAGAAASSATAAAPAAPENWSYDTDTDKMTSKVVYYAQTLATTELNLKFPYEGSKALIKLINKGGQTDAIFKVTKGQILAASELEGGHVQVRFDSDPPQSFTVSGPSDHSSNVIFFDPADKFVARLKTSKKVLIAAEFFENGTPQIEFNTSNLVWNH